jgi:thiamine-phosphate pyrophosphorylase
VAPDLPSLDALESLNGALNAGDVASLIIDPALAHGDALVGAVNAAIDCDVAAIIVGGRLVGDADGIQIESDAEALGAAIRTMGADKIVGAAGIATRHDAMTLGEANPDYLFFGRIDGDDQSVAHPRALELASWWAELFQIPSMVMGGSEIDSTIAAAVRGIEFVALGRAVWTYPDGPSEAVKAANALLDEAGQ